MGVSVSFEKFIEEIVLQGKDDMKNERMAFVEANLLPPNGKSASENIVEFLIERVKK